MEKTINGFALQLAIKNLIARRELQHGQFSVNNARDYSAQNPVGTLA